MYSIKTVVDGDDLKRLFNFLTETFYDDAIENKEPYFIMSERFVEMKKQFKIDNNFLMYIEEDGNIIAGLTGKNLNKKSKSISIGMLAVKKDKRREGLATTLIKLFEKKCKELKIKHIELEAGYRAYKLYKKLEYNYSLMIQVYDFNSIEDIRNNNKYEFEELSSKQNAVYGFITYKIDEIKKEYVNYYEDKIKTARVKFVFKKDI